MLQYIKYDSARLRLLGKHRRPSAAQSSMYELSATLSAGNNCVLSLRIENYPEEAGDRPNK